MTVPAYETWERPKWVLLEKFCNDTGYSKEAVIMKRKKGIWPDGIMTMVRGRRIHVNVVAYNLWVETGNICALAA